MPNVAEAGCLTAVAVVLEAGVMFQESALTDTAKGMCVSVGVVSAVFIRV